VSVALLQGNFPQSWEWRRENTDSVIPETYFEMTRQAAVTKPDIIVWPEYAILDDVFKNAELMKRIEKTVEASGSHLIFGALTELGGKLHGEMIRHDVAVVVSPDPAVTIPQQYISVHPLPFESWTMPGKELHTVLVENHRLGILLCWEETIPTIASRLSKQGAELFLSLSNNGRFKHTKGVYLTSLQTILRAAENRKFLVRTTNTGVTQVVNPCGRVTASTEPFHREILTTDVRMLRWITPYARYGDKPMMMMIFAVWICVLITGRRKVART